MTELVSGNRMAARGAISAGCRFFAGYPITPSTEIYQTMIDELPGVGGLAVAAPDEISAVCACVGASMAGVPAMTATSGPGWCLMIETVQYAQMTETPLVVAVVQRLGPSTGGATQGGQGDVLLTAHASSGGYTIPVFAPADARQCYDLARHAFYWAERLRTPVVLLSDKEVGTTVEGVETDNLARASVPSRTPFERAERYLPYAAPCAQQPPAFAPVGGTVRVVATGSAHDEAGHLQKNSPDVLANLRRLQEKIVAHGPEMARVSSNLEKAVDVLLVSYGVSIRSAREACRLLMRGGIDAAWLQVETLFPVPVAAIRAVARRSRRVMVIEENITGLYASVLRGALPDIPIEAVTGVGGLIAPSAVVTACREVR